MSDDWASTEPWPPRVYDDDDEPEGCARYVLGLVLACAVVVFILAAEWALTDRMVDRCLDDPQAEGCAAPADG